MLLSVIREAVAPHAGLAHNAEPPQTQALLFKTGLRRLLAAGLLFAIGNLLFIESGWYNLAADTPHFTPVRWALSAHRCD